MITIDSASGIIQLPKKYDYEELMDVIKEVLKINDGLFKCLYFSFIDEKDQERTRLIPQIYDDFLNQESPTVTIGFLDNINNEQIDELIELIEQNKKRFKKENIDLLLDKKKDSESLEINLNKDDDNDNNNINNDNNKEENIIIQCEEEKEEKEDNDKNNKNEEKIIIKNGEEKEDNKNEENNIIKVEEEKEDNNNEIISKEINHINSPMFYYNIFHLFLFEQVSNN